MRPGQHIRSLYELSLETTCDNLYCQLSRNVVFRQFHNDMAMPDEMARTAIKTEDERLEKSRIHSLREWLEETLNLFVRSELLNRAFQHEFNFGNEIGKNLQSYNINCCSDAYFKVWPVIFKVLFHPAMQEFVIPDVKSILIDRMYLKMEEHLVYHTGRRTKVLGENIEKNNNSKFEEKGHLGSLLNFK